MKKAFVGVIAATAVAIGFSSAAWAGFKSVPDFTAVYPGGAADVPDGKVAICHTPGHKEDFVIADFGGRCVPGGQRDEQDVENGQILVISKSACAAHVDGSEANVPPPFLVCPD